jgi:tetratricopeptide (TPR) repeat protein
MEDTRRYRTRGALVAVLVVCGVSVGGAVAQEAPAHPGDEPRMLEIPGSDNPRLAARQALREGQSSLESAAKALAKAREAEGKKREKLEASAQRFFETATQSFLVALQYDEDLVEAYVGLGEAWLDTGQAEKALQAWGAAQKRAPEDPEALFGLGRCLVELDRVRDAASVYINLAPRDAQRATELLGLLRAWGEPRAAAGDEEAQGLLAWIEQQDQH